MLYKMQKFQMPRNSKSEHHNLAENKEDFGWRFGVRTIAV
jgi:hypothetical protein